MRPRGGAASLFRVHCSTPLVHPEAAELFSGKRGVVIDAKKRFRLEVPNPEAYATSNERPGRVTLIGRAVLAARVRRPILRLAGGVGSGS
jgi:hypothetical protein